MMEPQDSAPDETGPTPAPVLAPPADAAAADASATPSADSATPAAQAAPDDGGAAATGAPPAAEPMSPALCGARLAALFPALFVAPGSLQPVKPIKLRIHADIQARAPGEFSKRVLGIFFSRYTTTNAYLKALVAPDAQRFDLDGEAAGAVAAEHRAAAAEELARRHAIAAERRAAQRGPARPAPVPSGDSAPPAQREGRSDVRRRPAGPPRAPRADEPRREQRSRSAGGQRAAPHSAPPPTRPPRRADAPGLPAAEPTAPAALPTDPAQRERVLLLRAFEASPLSKANFCALKRISEAELDAALALARDERR